jgi:SAM-dependent methyltransferase
MRGENIEKLYRLRTSRRWRERLYRLLRPPDPFVSNPREHAIDAPLGKWNLYVGGAGSRVPGYVNVDLFPLPGVTVAASLEQLPFPGNLFQRVECDAVLEHVGNPDAAMREIERVLAPGGYAHLVVPFCHPYHQYPSDFRRFTPDGLQQMAGSLEIAGAGWRTGPTATLLVFLLEYIKIWLPWRPARMLAHGVAGWLLFPLRYLDVLLFHFSRSGQIGNHHYLWLRKPLPGDESAPEHRTENHAPAP